MAASAACGFRRTFGTGKSLSFVSAMNLEIRQRVGEPDDEFAFRRVRTVALVTLATATVFGLWWPLFPFLDGYGMLVALLTGMFSAILGLVLVGLLVVLVPITLFIAVWYRLERRSEGMRRFRLRCANLERGVAPLVLIAVPTYVLLNAAVTKEMPRLKSSGVIQLSADPPMFYLAGFVWFIGLLVGVFWLVFSVRKPNDPR